MAVTLGRVFLLTDTKANGTLAAGSMSPVLRVTRTTPIMSARLLPGFTGGDPET